MKKFSLFIFGLILSGFLSFAQDETSVVIYCGRGESVSPQKILDMSYQDLKKFPVTTLNPEIEVLILDNNKLKELPAWIGQLKNLKILSLRNNNFKELDFIINNCENLEQLYLSGNEELSDISAISSTSNFKLIDVTGTKINSLPAGVQMMDSLFYFKYTKRYEKMQLPNDLPLNEQIELSTQKTDSDYLIIHDDSVEIPSLEIEVRLSGKAEKQLKRDKESVIVRAFLKGSPVKNIPDKYLDKLELDELFLFSYPIELTDKRIAKFNNLKFHKDLYDLLSDKDIKVLINVYSGRRSTGVNLLDCEVLQNNMSKIKGKRFVINGKLIHNEF